MLVPPFENECLRARRKITFNVPVADTDGHFLTSITSVEMRRLVLTMVHRDHDPEKAADLGHAGILRAGLPAAA